MSDNFELGLLPERKMDPRALASSYGLVAFVIVVGLLSRLIWPDQMPTRRSFTVTELIPRPDLRREPVKLPEVQQPKILAKIIPIETKLPQLVLPKIFKAPKPVQPKEIDPPKLEAKLSKPVLASVSAPRPAKLLYMGSFGSSAVATVNAPIEKVQTGGFGDPYGLKGQGNPAHLASASMGSFDLPQGAGHGNGAGGAKGIEGTIVSAGFGDGIARPGRGDGRASGVIAQTAFAAPALAAPVAKRSNDNGPATSPIEITFKPKPSYTEEARKLQLQGEVLLEVTFGANGQLHVNRVVRGLGHGLDESAVVATNNMKFKPAQRNGAPVDLTAVVHVTFELAM